MTIKSPKRAAEERAVENRAHNLKVAAELSWLAGLFQQHGLNSHDKQEVFKALARRLSCKTG